LLKGRRHREPALIVTISEGGFGVETGFESTEGDALRVRLLPHRGGNAVEITALVWNERTRFHLDTGETKRTLGCIVSEPPPEFLELVEELRRREAPSRRRLRSVRTDSSLPRPKDPLPPPKPEPEETLPAFRVRAKQLGGPRSRSLRVQARSAADAELRSIEQLGEAWEILEVVPERRGTPKN